MIYRADYGIFRRIEPNGERLFVASMTDDSPQHRMYPNGYDSRCNACWLNHAHSDALHRASVPPFSARWLPVACKPANSPKKPPGLRPRRIH